jgi:hypothetical protein
VLPLDGIRIDLGNGSKSSGAWIDAGPDVRARRNGKVRYYLTQARVAEPRPARRFSVNLMW